MGLLLHLTTEKTMKKILIAVALAAMAGQAHAYCSDGYVPDSSYWGGCRPANAGYQGSGFGYGESHDGSKSNTGSRYQQDYYPDTQGGIPTTDYGPCMGSDGTWKRIYNKDTGKLCP